MRLVTKCPHQFSYKSEFVTLKSSTRPFACLVHRSQLTWHILRRWKVFALLQMRKIKRSTQLPTPIKVSLKSWIWIAEILISSTELNFIQVWLSSTFTCSIIGLSLHNAESNSANFFLYHLDSSRIRRKKKLTIKTALNSEIEFSSWSHLENAIRSRKNFFI